MTSRWKLALLGVLALGILFVSAPASAQDASCNPDRECFVGCVAAANECRAEARKANAECLRKGCKELRDAREAACAAGRSPACREANVALQACVRKCQAEYTAALRACVDDAIECVATCAPDDSTPE